MNTRKSLKLATLCAFAVALVFSGGCAKKKAPIEPPPPPPPVEKAKPTVNLTASPTTIQKGKSSTLRWSSTDATNLAINQGIGDVSTSGSRSVSPSSSTTYTITAKGEGGTASASARVTVTTPPTPPRPKKKIGPTIEQLFKEKVKDIYFNYDQSDVRGDSKKALAKAATFLKQNPRIRFSIEGHCDERGSGEYNLGLGDRRANSTLSYLSSLGISSSRAKTISYGKERPQCSESSESCWKRNRRAHFVLSR